MIRTTHLRFLCLALAPCAMAAPVQATADIAGLDTDPAMVLAQTDSALATARHTAERITALQNRALALSYLSRDDEASAALDQAQALIQPSDSAARADLALARAKVLSNQIDFVAALAAADEARRLRTALHGPDDPRTAQAEATYGVAAMALGKTADALPVLEHAWRVIAARAPAGDPARADIGQIYATALSRARRSAEAEPLLRQLIAEADLLPPGHAQRAKVRVSAGADLLSQGRLGDALPMLREAVDESTRTKGMLRGERANALAVLGSALMQVDRPEDAAPFLAAAADLYGQSTRKSLHASALILAGGAADRAGDPARGLALRREALAIYQAMASGNELGVGLSAFKLAPAEAVHGDLERAETLAATAAETLARLRAPNHYQTTNSAIALGWIRVLRGRTAEGLALVRQAFALSVATNEQLELAKSQVVGVLDNVEAYSQALDAAVRAGDAAFAFEIMQVMSESDASRAALAVAAREGAAGSALGKLLRQRQEAGAALLDAEIRLTRALALEGEAEATQRAALRTDRDVRQAELAALDAALDGTYPGFRNLLRPRRLLLAEAQHRLGRKEALLIAVEGDLGLVSMAITRGGVAIGQAPLRRHAVRALVSRIRAGIDGGTAADFDAEAAHALYRGIFTPKVAALLPPGTRLRLATGDILSALPLSLLVTRPAVDGKPAHFLIEDHALSIVPSIAVLGQENPASDRRAARRLVAIGAPDADATAGNAPSRAAPLAPLPAARREMETVARLLGRHGPAQVLSGPEATEAAVRALDLRDVGVLLFATHGLVAGAFDGHSEPALVLAPGPGGDARHDGYLTASEAAQLDIGAQWVILSACNTAGGSHPSAAGYTGLARAFLFAGARRVVASHWPVRDDISARLSIGLVESMQHQQRADEALRQSILAVLHDNALPDARNPALWAPFMVIAR